MAARVPAARPNDRGANSPTGNPSGVGVVVAAAATLLKNGTDGGGGRGGGGPNGMVEGAGGGNCDVDGVVIVWKRELLQSAP